MHSFCIISSLDIPMKTTTEPDIENPKMNLVESIPAENDITKENK